MQQLKRGVLLAIEGIDGCGKSTLARNLYAECINRTLPTILTKEPGGSPLGKQLREILQKQETPLNAKAEYLLFAADRAEHFAKVIIPALEHKQLIISDRMSDSSIVYQGYGRGLDIPMIETVNRWTMNHIQPDLVLYVRLDSHTAQERIRARNETLTTFEQEHTSFIKRLAHGFEQILKNRANVVPLDGTHSISDLTQHAIDAVISWLNNHHLIQNS